jgi:UDP-glucose 4-epimerase
VVVTGGAGFIGVHTVRRLIEEGISVLVLDDLRHACGEPLPDRVEFQGVDLAMEGAADPVNAFHPDAILHLAAQGGVSRSVRDPAGDAMVNVVATVSMLKAAVDANCRRFVFASSGGAIYGHAERLPTPEDTTPKPLSPYGAAKLAAEGYLGMFSRTFGLSTLALRYSNVYGPYQDGTGEAGVVAITCERLLSGRPPEIRGDGGQTRDFVFVGDVAEANLRSLASDATGPVNIGTSIPTSVRTVVDQLKGTANFREPTTFVAGRPGEVRQTALDIERARMLLGWSPAVELTDGLRQTFMSFQERAARPGVSTRGQGAAAARPGPESPA